MPENASHCFEMVVSKQPSGRQQERICCIGILSRFLETNSMELALAPGKCLLVQKRGITGAFYPLTALMTIEHLLVMPVTPFKIMVSYKCSPAGCIPHAAPYRAGNRKQAF